MDNRIIKITYNKDLVPDKKLVGTIRTEESGYTKVYFAFPENYNVSSAVIETNTALPNGNLIYQGLSTTVVDDGITYYVMNLDNRYTKIEGEITIGLHVTNGTLTIEEKDGEIVVSTSDVVRAVSDTFVAYCDYSPNATATSDLSITQYQQVLMGLSQKIDKKSSENYVNLGFKIGYMFGGTTPYSLINYWKDTDTSTEYFDLGNDMIRVNILGSIIKIDSKIINIPNVETLDIGKFLKYYTSTKEFTIGVRATDTIYIEGDKEYLNCNSFQLSVSGDDNIKFNDIKLTDIRNAILKANSEPFLRQEADNELQAQIDTINASQNMVDIVGTYADLQAYDTTNLKANDKIEVLDDEHNNNSDSVYKWTGSAWELVGSIASSYTKAETDSLLQQAITASETYTNGLIVDNLDSTDSTKVLSANQGRVLKGYIDTLSSTIGTLNDTLEATLDGNE
jgi:hypothetical protein